MKRSLKLLTLILPLALMTGCFRMTMYSPIEQPEDVKLKKVFIDFDEHAKWHHAVLLGIIDLGGTKVHEECPNGVSAVHSRVTFLSGLATYFTGTLYAPQVNNILCANADAKAAPSDDAGAAADEGDAGDAGAAEEGGDEEPAE